MEFVSEIHGGVKSPQTQPKHDEISEYVQQDNHQRPCRRRHRQAVETHDETYVNDDSDSDSAISERSFVIKGIE